MDSVTYTVEYDSESGEWIATAGEYEYSADVALLAYAWLAAQMLDDDTET